jgi:hypothetical protein
MVEVNQDLGRSGSGQLSKLGGLQWGLNERLAVDHLGGRKSRQLWSVGEIKTGEDRASLLTESIIDTPDDVRSNEAPKPNARRHPVVFKTDIFEIVEDLPGIQKRRKLEIGRDTGDLRPCQMNALLDAGGDQILVDEPIDSVASKIVLSAQRTLFKKWHLIPQRDLQVCPNYEDRALGFAREELLHIQFITRVHRVIAVAHVLSEFGIGRNGHPIGRRGQIISRIVVERRAVPDDDRLALYSVNGREYISGKWQVRRASLQAHLAEALANRDLCHLVGIDTEAPIRSRFSGRVVRFISLNGGLTKAEKSRRRVLEERAAEVEKIPSLAERRIGVIEDEFAFDFLGERGDELHRPATGIVAKQVKGASPSNNGVPDQHRSHQIFQLPVRIGDEDRNDQSGIAPIVLGTRHRGNGEDLGIGRGRASPQRQPREQAYKKDRDAALGGHERSNRNL